MDSLHDRRGINLVFMHSKVDDLGLTVNAFRVYCHLARRAGKDSTAFPSYQNIGNTCFGSDVISKDWRRQLAINAMSELIRRGLVIKNARTKDDGSPTSNLYELTPPDEWV